MYNHLACYGGWECVQCTDKPAREIHTLSGIWNREIMSVLVDGSLKYINTSNHVYVGNSQTNACSKRVYPDPAF